MVIIVYSKKVLGIYANYGELAQKWSIGSAQGERKIPNGEAWPRAVDQELRQCQCVQQFATIMEKCVCVFVCFKPTKTES